MSSKYGVQLALFGENPKRVVSYLREAFNLSPNAVETRVEAGGVVADDLSEARASRVAEELVERGAEASVVTVADETTAERRCPPTAVSPRLTDGQRTKRRRPNSKTSSALSWR